MRESQRVVRGAHLGIVIEKDVDIAARGSRRRGGNDAFGFSALATLRPGGDGRGPRVESLGAVAAGVELLGTVQAAIDKRRRRASLCNANPRCRCVLFQEKANKRQGIEKIPRVTLRFRGGAAVSGESTRKGAEKQVLG